MRRVRNIAAAILNFHFSPQFLLFLRFSPLVSLVPLFLLNFHFSSHFLHSLVNIYPPALIPLNVFFWEKDWLQRRGCRGGEQEKRLNAFHLSCLDPSFGKITSSQIQIKLFPQLVFSSSPPPHPTSSSSSSLPRRTRWTQRVRESAGSRRQHGLQKLQKRFPPQTHSNPKWSNLRHGSS